MTGRSIRKMSGHQRKTAVVALYGAYGLAASLWIGTGGLKTLPVAIAVTLLMLAVFGALAVLFRSTHYWKWGNSPDAQLDEYEIASRNNAYKSAYVLIASLSLLAMLFVRIGRDIAPFTLSETAIELLFWGWFLVVVTLPSAILAWSDNPLDDEDEPALALK